MNLEHNRAKPGSIVDGVGRGAEFVPLHVTLRDERTVTIRAVRSDDALPMQAAFSRLSAEARYARFMAPLRELPPAMLQRAVGPLADRERALVAVAREEGGKIIVGGARYLAAVAQGTCEFAVTIADGWQAAGLGSRMMREIIRDAQFAGWRCMEGFVLASNRPMLALARRIGFEVMPSDEGPSVRLVRLDLGRGGR